MTTSEKLEVAIKRQGYTQKAVAEKLGTSQANLSKKFKFDDWRESDIKAICNAIGVSFETVLKFENGDTL